MCSANGRKEIMTWNYQKKKEFWPFSVLFEVWRVVLFQKNVVYSTDCGKVSNESWHEVI